MAQWAGKYELLLKEEIQRENNSKPTYFNNPSHQVEIVEESDEETWEDLLPKVSLVEIVKIQDSLSCKVVMRPSKKQRNNHEPTGGFVLYKQNISHIPPTYLRPKVYLMNC